MAIAAALAVIAAGAVLKWAVTAHTSGIDLQTLGTVLFVIGLVGLALAVGYTIYLAQRLRPDGAYDHYEQPPPAPHY